MASRIWLGNAVAIKDKWTITIANTWATSDTATITINGNDLVITIGTLVTTAQVATTIKQAFMNETLTDTSASFSPSGGGPSIPEFNQITATVSGSVVTLTANTAGVPWTISSTEVTAGTGTATAAHATTATGPNYFDNVDNWSGGAVPTGSDDVYFDDGNVDCLYGLDQNATTLTTLTISARYTGKIGLPVKNGSGSAQYAEYRDTYLKISATTVTIGRGTGNGSGRIKINFGSVQTAVSVFNTGSRTESGFPSLMLRGTHASNVLNVYNGDVGVAILAAETSTIATLRQVGGNLYCGSGVTLTTINKAGGTLTTESAATTVSNDNGDFTLKGGAHTTINVSGGTLYYESSGTITTLSVYQNGTANFNNTNLSRTVTNCNLTGGGTISDRLRTCTFTNGIKIFQAGVEDCNLQLGKHLTITPATY
jgi:hypothetical protein